MPVLPISPMRHFFCFAVLGAALAGPALAQPGPPTVVWSAPGGSAVHAVAFAPDGQTLASAGAVGADSTQGRVDVWAAADGASVAGATAHPSAPGGLGAGWSVAFAPDGAALASTHGAGTFTWTPALAPLTGRLDAPGAANGVAHGSGVLAVASADGPVRLLDAATLAEIRVLAGHAGGARAVAMSPDGARVASVGMDGRLRVWDAATGAELYAVEHGPLADGGLPISVAFSPNGALIATGGDGTYSETVRVWEAADGTPVYTYRGGYVGVGDIAITSVAFSPNGRYLLAGLNQRRVQHSTGNVEWRGGLWFWDLVAGRHAALYEDASPLNTGGVTSVAMSAAHDHLFAYAIGNEVRMAETPLSLATPPLGEGFFTLVPTTLPQGDTYEAVAPADYDSDGDLDLLVIRGAGQSPDALTPELYRNDGPDDDGGFVFTPVPFPAEAYPTPQTGGDPKGETLAWGDYDSDGDVDALVATAFGTTLYRNDGGTFVDSGLALPRYRERAPSSYIEAASAAWGDVDNDGDLDLVLPATSPSDPDPSIDWTLAILHTNTGGVLTPADTLARVDRDPGVVWGDVEGDGDLDLLYLSVKNNCGEQPGVNECLVLYENEGGQLTPLPLAFARFGYFGSGSADFGDFDLDGDLDILFVASLRNPNGPPSRIDRALVFRNDGTAGGGIGPFTADTLAFPFSFDEYFQTLNGGQWADYDSDGDMDIVISADVNDYGGPNPDFGGVAFVFANTDGAFSLAAALPASRFNGTSTWADFDGDGDLDHLTTGLRDEAGVPVQFARLYRSDQPAANAPPAAPAGLTATTTADGAALVWQPATDDHTPSQALTYNLHVATVDGQDIVSPHARPGSGGRLLPEPGNVSHDLHWALRSLPPGTYRWSVQAVDNAFNAGPFAPGGTFTVGSVDAAAGPAEPAVLALAPNPTAGASRATLVLPAAAHATVEVLDALGRRVAVLADGDLGAGAHAWPLDGARLAPGVYAVRAQVEAPGGPTEVLVGRLTVVR